MISFKLKLNQFCTGLVLLLLRIYKKTFSGLFWGSCRYNPTCSEYTYQQVKKHGTIKGLWRGLKRLSQCHV